MNTVQNGKGDSPRNNYGPKWYANYEEINWHRPKVASKGNASQSQPLTTVSTPDSDEAPEQS